MSTIGDIVNDLRALGVRVTLRSGYGRVGMTFTMHGTALWDAAFAARVRDVLADHGMTENAEGFWVSAGAPPDVVDEAVEMLRDDDEYERQRAQEDE
jgi:hypothetical protein